VMLAIIKLSDKNTTEITLALMTLPNCKCDFEGVIVCDLKTHEAKSLFLRKESSPEALNETARCS
jgi:hypothetical protein